MEDNFVSVGLPGYRLYKVQIMNWGTIDSSKGQIHTVRPNGRTSLLIGQNGSGKSTMVDSILTLLVRPGIRNYNVAAGSSGKKRERDERSYLMGAYGHASSDSENKASTLYLRKEGRHLSILLGYFYNADTKKGFTVSQVLYCGADGKVEKVFCFAKGEKDIAEDFADIKSIDQISKKLEARDIKTTKTFTQYHKWLINEANMRPKAMDVFNQTVAVKDIRSLTEFIRGHMLEGQNWKERIDDILNHFQQLSDAHRMLVDAREQSVALQPIAQTGAEYNRLREELQKREQTEKACDAYFRVKTVDLFTRVREERLVEGEGITAELEGLNRRLDDNEQQIRRLQNDVENAGGERLRSLPFLLEQKQEDSKRRRERADRYGKALSKAGLAGHVSDEAAFQSTHEALNSLRAATEQELQTLEEGKLNSAIRAHKLEARRDGLDLEIRTLQEQGSNLPERHQQLRKQICDGLGMDPAQLPFAAELIAIKDTETDWTSAAESSLRDFGLTLLVPADRFRDVSSFVEQLSLRDSNDSMKLAYLRVGEVLPDNVPTIDRNDESQLVNKLDYKVDHPWIEWVRTELIERYNFKCCESFEDFREVRTMALTADRHINLGRGWFEKDDRELVTNPRHYILGWDNEAKLQVLRKDLTAAQEDVQRLLVEMAQNGDQVTELRGREEAIRRAQEVRVFAEIDHEAVDRELAELRREKEMLETSNEAVSAVTSQLGAATSQKHELKGRESQLIKRLGVLEREISQATTLLETSQRQIQSMSEEGDFEAQKALFPSIEDDLLGAGVVLNAETLAEQENHYTADLRNAIDSIRSKLAPVEKSLLQSMSRFLRKFRQFEHELRDDPSYLDDFLNLHVRLEQEDLPKHEGSFKERLNEKVTTEIGILNNQLDNEREEILTRIETLNRCLETIDYDSHDGTYMQLEPKPVRDAEIAEFQRLMRECLADAFEGNTEADEARFARIEGLINRLREDARWREKVTDVRRWFDFGAQETVRSTGEERGYYSDSMGQSGGEKAKLAFTILVAAVVYQFDIDPEAPQSDKFHFVVVDEMFSKIDDRYAEYALRLFDKFGLQLLIVAPFDAKAKVTEPFVDYYIQVVKKNNRSRVLTMTSGEFGDRFGEVTGMAKRSETPEPEPATAPSSFTLGA
ncbi:MAG: SbcC/MukB-like Walker B domain-containing protein [Verrucomicrobiota bacterium]